MRIKTSYADFVTDWQKLIAAIDGDPDLADLKNKPLLEAQLAAVTAINARQKQHAAARQQATQELNTGLLKGKDIAIQLRAEVKSLIDPRAERLTHFDVKPIRKKPRKAKPPGGEPEPETAAKAKGAKAKAAAQPETPTDP
jgi:hypothetical protein